MNANNWSFDEIAQVVASPSSLKIGYGNLMSQDSANFTTYMAMQMKNTFDRFSRLNRN